MSKDINQVIKAFDNKMLTDEELKEALHHYAESYISMSIDEAFTYKQYLIKKGALLGLSERDLSEMFRNEVMK